MQTAAHSLRLKCSLLPFLVPFYPFAVENAPQGSGFTATFGTVQYGEHNFATAAIC